MIKDWLNSASRHYFGTATACMSLLSALCSLTVADTGASSAEQLLSEAGFRGGVVVDVGCGDGRSAARLHGEHVIVQGLDSDRTMIEAALQRAADAGGRLSFRYWPGGVLPYVDNLVNVLIWRDRAGTPDLDEIMRVLAPHGKAYIQSEAGWEKRVKPWPDNIDTWPHFRYDAGGTGMSRDRQVGPPRHLQWTAGPRFMRSHEIETGISCIVSDNGRIYYILDEGPLGITDARFPAKWALLCRDAFNGALLWRRTLPDWGWQHWSEETRVNDPNTWLGLRTKSPDVDRLLAAAGDVLYVTLGFGAPVSALDGVSGETLRVYEETAGALEFLVHKGMLLTRRDGTNAIVAIRAEDGAVQWQRAESLCLGRSLAAAGDRVFYHNRDELIALDLETGEELWRQTTRIRPAMVIAASETVLAIQSAVVMAFDANTGAPLWQAPGVQTRGRHPDLFVGNGLVWSGQPEFNARDAVTGDIVRELALQSTLETGHHWRCYANRASSCYMITAARGAEFLDLNQNEHRRHNWFRGPCISGMLPANGLLYVPPHQCFCYPAVRMDGFFALTAHRETQISPEHTQPASRLEKGPAYGLSQGTSGFNPDDWPMYRKNAARSGSAATDVPAELVRHWATPLGGALSPAVVAGNSVFVAQKDTGTVHCLDFNSGSPQWQHTVSGAIDSPPAVYSNHVIFGARDGWVYCLRADDGTLAWRFLAAPDITQVVSHERLESVWPVHGSVLLFNDLVYCTAGRSGFLDGGIRLYALDPLTGAVVHQNTLEGPWPDINEPSYAFHKDGHRADLLTTDGQYLYMGRTVLDKALNEIDAERINMIGAQRGDYLEYRVMPGMRLVATAGLLDDSFWNRSWWMYARVWPGFHYAQQAPKSGQLLVFDDKNTFTVKHYTTRNRHSPMLFPGSGYLLFADANDNEPLFYRGEGEPAPIEWEPELPIETRWTIYQDAGVDKGPGFTRSHPALWTTWVDVRVESMALARNHLFVAGTPDTVPDQDPLAAIEGRMGGVLQVISKTDGQRLAEYSLDTRTVFDGLTAARGCLILVAGNGQVIRMGAPTTQAAGPVRQPNRNR